MTRIFISHSHLDEEIADLLIDFLSESIEISKKDIRCTSDPNHGLDFSSSSISDQLKNDLQNAGALIVLTTIDSLRSPWILFEVGSFWTTDKLVAPIIGPGLTFEDLPGPLRGYRSIRIEDDDVSYQLNELINQLARKLTLKQSGVTRRRDKKLEAFINHFRDWESQLPVLDVSQQESIENLIQKVEAIETRSRQEKQELEQSLQSQINELEQQLEQARSQSNQAQEIKLVSQREKEQLEQKIQSYKTQISQLERELEKARSQAVKQLEEQKRSHQQQIEEIQATSQQEKEDKERNYQNQKQNLKQSLQYQISQLEQKLAAERSQVAKQLEEKERSLQSRIEQLEKELKKAQSQVEQVQKSKRSQAAKQLGEKERSLQSRIEQLEQELLEARSQVEQVQESERLYSAQLQTKGNLERSLKLRIEKLEKERLHNQEKEKLERSLKSKIEQLEKELEKAQSQVEQVQKSKRSLQQQLEEIETTSRQEKQELERLRRQQGTLTINRRQLLKWAGLGTVGLMTAVVAREIFKSPQPISVAEPKYFLPSEEASKVLGVGPLLWIVEFETVTVDRKGEIVERSNKQAKLFKEDLGNGINLEMVLIPGGTFMMGSPEGEGGDNEKPQHEVAVQPLFIGKYQITQAEWKAISSLAKIERDLEPDPSRFKGDDLPVENVSWNDAVEFCQRLSNLTEKEYRLPSETEWEYACRAGTTTPFHFGKTITSNLANYNARRIYASEPKGRFREKTIQVGSFPPNSFGLYDMYGNVWEWCQDDWHDNYESAPQDRSARLSDKNITKVMRGGSWVSDPRNCRSAYRVRLNPEDSDDFSGFRVVCGGART